MKKLIVAVAALALMAGSAYASDWNFYGSARVATFYTQAEVVGAPGSVDTIGESLQGNSRIGATVKVSDELTGGFEYGTGVNVRKLFGEWNFGAGKLLVGQDYTPLNIMYSNQVFAADNDMLAQGGVYSGRAPMLRLTFGNFQIAAVSPNTNISTSANGTEGAAATNVEVKIPAIEAAYSLKLDNVTFDLQGGYNSFQTNNQDVDSYVVALGADAKLGAFHLAADIYAGQNAGNLISIESNAVNYTAWNDGYAYWNGTSVVDNDNFGYCVLAGYTVNEMVAFEAGYGYSQVDYNASVDDEVQTYYVNATITLAPGVFVVPEIGKIDGKEAGNGDTTYYGAKWQINF